MFSPCTQVFWFSPKNPYRVLYIGVSQLLSFFFCPFMSRAVNSPQVNTLFSFAFDEVF